MVDRDHPAGARGVLNDVGRHLSGDNGDTSALRVAAAGLARELTGEPPRFSDMTWVGYVRNHITANEPE